MNGAPTSAMLGSRHGAPLLEPLTPRFVRFIALLAVPMTREAPSRRPTCYPATPRTRRSVAEGQGRSVDAAILHPGPLRVERPRGWIEGRGTEHGRISTPRREKERAARKQNAPTRPLGKEATQASRLPRHCVPPGSLGATNDSAGPGPSPPRMTKQPHACLRPHRAAPEGEERRSAAEAPLTLK
jgi:hypothetical protein